MSKTKLRVVHKNTPSQVDSFLSWRDYDNLKTFIVTGKSSSQLDFFLETLHEKKQWVVCDCLGSNTPIEDSPTMTVAKSQKGNLFIRNIISRKPHSAHCPFAYTSSPKKDKTEKVATPPPCLLSKPLNLHRAQGQIVDTGGIPDSERAAASSSRHIYPRLGQVMLHLMSESGMLMQGDRFNFVDGYNDLRAAAKNMEAFPGTPLDDVLCLSHKKESDLIGRIRREKYTSSNAYGIMMIIVHAIDPKTKIFKRFDRNGGIEWSCRPVGEVKIWSRRSVSKGPFMVAFTYATTPGSNDIIPQHAFALPILSNSKPLPVESQLEREVSASIMKYMKWRKEKDGLTVLLEKPMYDIEAPSGKCRPDFVVRGAGKKVIIEVMGMLSDEDYVDRKERTVPIMKSFAPVYEIAKEKDALPLREMNIWINQQLSSSNIAVL